MTEPDPEVAWKQRTDDALHRLNELVHAGVLTQAETAKQLGIHEGSVSFWLSGRWRPKAEKVVALEALLQEHEALATEGRDTPPSGSEEREKHPGGRPPKPPGTKVKRLVIYLDPPVLRVLSARAKVLGMTVTRYAKESLERLAKSLSRPPEKRD